MKRGTALLISIIGGAILGYALFLLVAGAVLGFLYGPKRFWAQQ